MQVTPIAILVVLACGAVLVSCDTPAHCLYEQYEGEWVFTLGPAGQSNTEVGDCSQSFKTAETWTVRLSYPDVVERVDMARGSPGFWTMIYDEGAEVTLAGRKFFAFAYYTQDGKNSTSYCDKTFHGWYHDEAPTQPPRNWGCYQARRKGQLLPTFEDQRTERRLAASLTSDRPYGEDATFVSKLNSAQNSWTAVEYPELSRSTIGEVQRMAGTRITAPRRPSKTLSMTDAAEEEKLLQSLPTSLDWRNKDGKNFVSPIRNQGSCGSCYTFGTLAMLEARIRIKSDFKEQPILSTQDVVSCSNYSQGCDGGFPYLVAKYGQDFSLMDEDCFPYSSAGGTAPSCDKKCKNPKQYWFTGYSYIGGYYGASTEGRMMAEILANGPIAVSFEVHNDFMHYKGGIYYHASEVERFNPFEVTNHVVSIIGWGEENGEKYWIVKNSWGTSWGERGFFRIRRGTDECAIESMSERAFWVEK